MSRRTSDPPSPRVPWIRPYDADSDPAYAVKFYLGAHQPSWLMTSTVPLFVSVRRLADRKRGGDAMPKARVPWAMDSGGFSELMQFGEWQMDPDTYGGMVTRLIEDCGWPPDFVAPQDWMCEPWVIAGGTHNGMTFVGTGLDVATHQEITVENYVYLVEQFPFVPWAPVLQGWTLDDYLRCVDMYRAAGVDLKAAPIVGLGSVCRRQSTGEIGVICQTLAALGLRLHGFGVKRAGLEKYAEHLASADSMAWSFTARNLGKAGAPRGAACTHAGPCNNCLPYAIEWRDGVLEALRDPKQTGMTLDVASSFASPRPRAATRTTHAVPERTLSLF